MEKKDPSNPLWSAYDNAAKKLGAFGGSSAKAARQNVEQEYAIAHRRLVLAGLAMQIKRKYRM